jgi:hypothetical protein
MKGVKIINPKSFSLRQRRRFWSLVKKSSGCWIWLGRKSDRGYGSINFNGVCYQSHRLSVALAKNIILSSEAVLHKCDTPSCVRPIHLKPGTQKKNVNDAIKKGRHVLPKSLPGCQSNNGVLNREQVLAMRKMRKDKGMVYHKIAARFGISKESARKAVKGITYPEVIT